MRLLRAHAWPGNVRELFAVVESAAIRAGGPRIEAQHLPAAIRDPDELLGMSRTTLWRRMREFGLADDDA